MITFAQKLLVEFLPTSLKRPQPPWEVVPLGFGKQRTFHASPTLDQALVPQDQRSLLEKEVHSVEAWVLWFEKVSSGGGISPPTPGVADDEVEIEFGPGEECPRSPSRALFEEPFLGMTPANARKERFRISEDTRSAGGGSEESAGWSALGDILEAAASEDQLASRTGDSLERDVKSFKLAADREFDGLETKVSVINAKLGQRPIAFGTQGAWKVLEDHDEELAKLKTSQKASSEGTGAVDALAAQLEALTINTQDAIAELKDAGNRTELLVNEVATALTEGGCLNDAISRSVRFTDMFSNQTPGDLLVQQLADLRSSPGGVTSTGRARSVGFTVGSLGSGGSGPTNVPATTPSVEALEARLSSVEVRLAQIGSASMKYVGPTVASDTDEVGHRDVSTMSGMRSELERIRDDLATLKNLLTSGGIEICGRPYTTTSKLYVWCARTEAPLCLDWCIDAFSLLELSQGGTETNTQTLKWNADSKKAGFSGASEGTICSSLNKVLPAIFGSITAGGSSKTLPGVPSLAAWDSRQGSKGNRAYFQTRLNDEANNLTNSINAATCKAEAKELGRLLVADSREFCTRLFGFMTQYSDNLTAEDRATDSEAWELVSGIVREIFYSLHNVRSNANSVACRTVSEEEGAVAKRERVTIVLWWTLKTHKLMREFLSHGFKGHPSIIPIVNDHLLETSVSRQHVQHINDTLKVHASAIGKLQGGGAGGLVLAGQAQGAAPGAGRRAGRRGANVAGGAIQGAPAAGGVGGGAAGAAGQAS